MSLGQQQIIYHMTSRQKIEIYPRITPYISAITATIVKITRRIPRVFALAKETIPEANNSKPMAPKEIHIFVIGSIGIAVIFLSHVI